MILDHYHMIVFPEWTVIKEEIVSQIKLKFDIFKSTDIPEKLKSIKAIKPGSRNL